MTLSNATRALLSGRKICAVTLPAEHAWLVNPANTRAISDYLEQIEFGLGRLGDEVFWLIDLQNDVFDRDATRRQIHADYREAGPLVSFLELAMRRDPDAGLPAVGDQFRLNEITGLVENNPVLTEDLIRLANSLNVNPTYSLGERLRSIAQKLSAMGYLQLFDRDRDIWLLTGRIGYFHRFREIVQRVAPDFGEDMARDLAAQQGELF